MYCRTICTFKYTILFVNHQKTPRTLNLGKHDVKQYLMDFEYQKKNTNYKDKLIMILIR